LKRPTIIIVLQGIVLLALIISISLHKIIFAFEYFKDNPDAFTSYGLAGMQFLFIIFFGFLSYGLLKRKSYALWGSIIFFVMILFGYNIFVVLLGKGPIHIIKFIIITGGSLFFVYQLAFSDTIRQFFRLKR
jgi:hypothetical protein